MSSQQVNKSSSTQWISVQEAAQILHRSVRRVRRYYYNEEKWGLVHRKLDSGRVEILRESAEDLAWRLGVKQNEQPAQGGRPTAPEVKRISATERSLRYAKKAVAALPMVPALERVLAVIDRLLDEETNSGGREEPAEKAPSDSPEPAPSEEHEEARADSDIETYDFSQ